MTQSVLPHYLAAINAATIVTLLLGYRFVRSGRIEAHRTTMKVAMALGVAFLALYLAYHLGAGLAKFGGMGAIRPVYFTILIIHIIAAAAAAVLVPLTFWRGWSGQTAAHRKIAPRTWALWLFVAVSGLVVYVMTIHLWPMQAVVTG